MDKQNSRYRWVVFVSVLFTYLLMTRSDASQLIMIGLIGALIGAPLASWISSRLETIKRPYIVVHIIVLLGWFSFLLCNGHPSFFFLIIIFFIIGFGYGASALTFAAVRQSFKLEESGIVSGIANTGGFLSAVLLPIIFGYILDHFQSTSGNLFDGYYYGFITPVIFFLTSIVIEGIKIRITSRGKEYGSKATILCSCFLFLCQPDLQGI
ncbi:MFS transporter [Lysinibacillus xylanilyticus]|uniref:MFS transporter n=1 Tax=Lysinibacillus xylanilyticus TaxID=582475 RepID=UPI0037F1ECF1